MKRKLLRIADLYLWIDDTLTLPENYTPFKVKTEQNDIPVICKVSCDYVPPSDDTPFEISDLDKTEVISVSCVPNGGYLFTICVQKEGRCYRLYATSDWKQVVIDRSCMETSPYTVINKFLMLSFIYAASAYQTVLLHASSVKIGEEGVAFIGQSGAGKSTHSNLWLNYIPGTELLNDDQPAVRVTDEGIVKIYGTPWSGKTACYKAEEAVLKGIFRMIQADDNQVLSLLPVFLFRELLASCSMMKTEPETFKKIISTLAKITSRVPGFILRNRPEKEAAWLAFLRMKR